MTKQHEPFEIVDKRKAGENGVSLVTPKSPIILSAERVYEDPRPRFDYVLVARKEAETTWNGTKFFIPETVVKKPNQGVVIAVSDFYIVDGKTFPTADIVRPGDVVTFGNFQAEDVARDGKEFSLVSVFDLKLIEKVHFEGENSAASA